MKNCITLSLSIPLKGQIYTKLLTIKFVMIVLITLSMLMMSKIPSKNKPVKSDGFDGLTSDFLINASTLFYVYLSHLFTTMLY